MPRIYGTFLLVITIIIVYLMGQIHKTSILWTFALFISWEFPFHSYTYYPLIHSQEKVLRLWCFKNIALIFPWKMYNSFEVPKHHSYKQLQHYHVYKNMLFFFYGRLMKLSSPKLNYLILAGATILYINIFFFIIPTTNPSTVTVLCNVSKKCSYWIFLQQKLLQCNSSIITPWNESTLVLGTLEYVPSNSLCLPF